MALIAPLALLALVVAACNDEGGGGRSSRNGSSTGDSGQLRAVRYGNLDAQPVLDLTADVGSGGERGLLGIAFSSDGTKIPDLRGAYVFSDYCDSTLRALTERSGKLAGQRDLGVKGNQITAFGEGQDGELYVLSQGDSLQRIDPA